MIKMKVKLNIIDYIIIVLVICGVVFAFVHVTANDDTINESTSYDASTLSKISDKYLTYYKDGYIVNTTVTGYNASNGEPVTLSGTILWMDDDKTNVKALVDTADGTHFVGLYNQINNADVYIKTMTLEINGDKYSNLTEVKIQPKNITSFNDLVSGIPNDTDYEISGTVSLDEIETTKFQEINNILSEKANRTSIKGLNTGIMNQINVVRATNDEITPVNQVVGDFNGVTSELVIRIYNCDDNDINTIKQNYNVTNIQKF